MAKIELTLPTDMAERLSKLADRTDDILPRVLESGGEVVLDKVKDNFSSVIGRGTKEPSRSTGELQNSLGLSKAHQKRDGSGWDVKVGFAEPRSDGGSNAKVVNIIEFGKHNQPPKPFLKPAKSQSKTACIEAMKAKLSEELDRI